LEKSMVTKSESYCESTFFTEHQTISQTHGPGAGVAVHFSFVLRIRSIPFSMGD